MRSFTLIETIVVIFIFTLALGGISGLIVMAYRTQSYTWEQSMAIYEARRGIETMVREVRTAQTADDGSYAIYRTENYEFGFYANIDNDVEVEKVRYFIEGSDFKKEVIKPVGIPATYPDSKSQISLLSQYVRNTPPIFRYFDENGNELPPPARKKDTKLMEVYLVINVDPNRPPQDFELKSKVQIRNLKREF